MTAYFEWLYLFRMQYYLPLLFLQTY